jgi:peptidoglycan-associated lipoprotein
MRAKVLSIAALGAGLLGLTACAGMTPGKPMGFAPCDDVRVAIYFEPNVAEISREARAVLKGAADQARGCHVDGVDVMGLADAVGAADANLTLSEQRAAAVTKTLTGLGLTQITVGAAGDAGAVTGTGASAPLRRRADVVVKLSAK